MGLLCIKPTQHVGRIQDKFVNNRLQACDLHAWNGEITHKASLQKCYGLKTWDMLPKNYCYMTEEQNIVLMKQT